MQNNEKNNCLMLYDDLMINKAECTLRDKKSNGIMPLLKMNQKSDQSLFMKYITIIKMHQTGRVNKNVTKSPKKKLPIFSSTGDFCLGCFVSCTVSFVSTVSFIFYPPLSAFNAHRFLYIGIILQN